MKPTPVHDKERITMFTKRTAILFALIAAISMLGLGVARAASKLMASPTAVAVVDIGAVFRDAKALEQFRADNEKMQADLKAQSEEKKKELDKIKFELDALDKTSADYRKKTDDLQFKTYEYDFWSKYQTAKVQHELGLQMHKLYRDICNVIATVAQEQGYDLVVYNDSTAEINWSQVQDLQAQISLRKVLYAADAIDITDQVLQRLNTM